MRPIRRPFLWMVAACTLAMVSGCASSILRTQSPEPASAESNAASTKLVGDYASPSGNNYIRVEGPVLITNLAGTGSDPAPGPERAALLSDMQARGVVDPNKILSSPNTSLAWAVTIIPPGVQKGDRLDVEVRVPQGSETKSLAGGWMMQARLKEMAMLGGSVHEGHVLAIAEGPVLVDPVMSGNADAAAEKRGLVLGGGVALKSRNLALVMRSKEKSAPLSKRIGDVINRRMYSFIKGSKRGVANPKTDEYIELLVHPRYENNLNRYMRVVRCIPLFETPQQQIERLDLLEKQLFDPVTSAQAAIRLEAIGKDAVRVLKKGLESTDPEVRFYSAEALAYLDESMAVPALADAARNHPAFRAYAFTALSALNDVQASDALRDLFDVASAETRYGAFRALREMDERDPMLRGEHLNEQFWLHTVPSSGPPMIHLTHSKRPEVVLFGEGQKFKVPFVLEAGSSIIIKSTPAGQVSVARFKVGAADKRVVVENSIADVVRAMAEVGGDYPAVVHALQQARRDGALTSRLEVDAIPERDREYRRRQAEENEPEVGDAPEVADRRTPSALPPDHPVLSEDNASGEAETAAKLTQSELEMAAESEPSQGANAESTLESAENSGSRRKRWWIQ